MKELAIVSNTLQPTNPIEGHAKWMAEYASLLHYPMVESFEEGDGYHLCRDSQKKVVGCFKNTYDEALMIKVTFTGLAPFTPFVVRTFHHNKDKELHTRYANLAGVFEMRMTIAEGEMAFLCQA